MRTTLLFTACATSLLLAACGQTETQTVATDTAEAAELVPVSAETESMADVAEASATVEAAPPPVEAPPPSTSFAGEYEGSFAEGGTGYVTLTGAGPTYRAEIVVTTPDGCAGEVRGEARADGDTLILRAPHDDGVCTITMQRSGQSLAVSEDNCLHWHGMGCRFDGTARRTQ